MANNLILTKESSESEIRAYFNAVLKLSKSDNEFPIDFDEVWMLVYQDRRSAVYELKDKFLQDVDYQMVRKKVQASNVAGYVWSDDYYLTPSCMEFFIARKVRPVFEVYRRVFHGTSKKAVESKEIEKPTLTDKMKVATWLIKTLNLNDASKLSLAKSIADPLGLPTPDYAPSKGVLKSATELLKEKGIQISTKAFNRKAIESGILQDVQRNSSKGTVKHFKSITKKGEAYGENQVCPNNPKETQPLWYASQFDELLKTLNLQFI